jgi:retinol dehydrogenase 12
VLEPILIRTAASSPPFSVRIVFVVAIMQLGTIPGGMSFDGNGNPIVLPRKDREKYMQTKVGGTWLAAELANRLRTKDILSVVSLSNDLQ